LTMTSSTDSRLVRAARADTPVEPPSIAVVACIEAGELETKTIRMVDSLRRFGGRFADLEVIAVTPRFGPRLASKTRTRLSELGVRHIQIHPKTDYVWHHYMNKAQAVMAAEREVTTDQILWIDSDIIFLREPNDLELPPGIDFAASAPDTGLIGSQGADDPQDAFWSRCANLIGQRVEGLPWLTTGDGHRIRFYWNAGLYIYRRSSCFGREFTSDFERSMRARVARNHAQVHGMDQVILGLTVLRLGLAWRAIPDTSNFPVLSFLPDNFDPAKVLRADVLHYHDSMGLDLWPKLLATLEPSHPQVYQWLASLGPIADPASRGARLLREALRVKRGVDRRLYYSKSGFTKSMKTAV
jgi:hypothetical protein